jgi:hypothetical protein
LGCGRFDGWSLKTGRAWHEAHGIGIDSTVHEECIADNHRDISVFEVLAQRSIGMFDTSHGVKQDFLICDAGKISGEQETHLCAGVFESVGAAQRVLMQPFQPLDARVFHLHRGVVVTSREESEVLL